MRGGDRRGDGDQGDELALEARVAADDVGDDRARVGAAAGVVADLGGLQDVEQRRGDGGVELGAGAAAQLVEGDLARERAAVGAVAVERVPGVAGEDDARRERDRVADEPVRVAVAVPALVLVAHGAGDGLQAGDGREDALADHRVLAHEHPLRGVERAGLVEERVGDADLADVVEQGDGGELGHLLAAQAEAGADGDREVVHGVGVLAGVAVAGLEGRGERLDDRAHRLRGAAALALEVAQDGDERVVALREAARGRHGLLAQLQARRVGVGHQPAYRRR